MTHTLTFCPRLKESRSLNSAKLSLFTMKSTIFFWLSGRCPIWLMSWWKDCDRLKSLCFFTSREKSGKMRNVGARSMRCLKIGPWKNDALCFPSLWQRLMKFFKGSSIFVVCEKIWIDFLGDWVIIDSVTSLLSFVGIWQPRQFHTHFSYSGWRMTFMRNVEHI